MAEAGVAGGPGLGDGGADHSTSCYCDYYFYYYYYYYHNQHHRPYLPWPELEWLGVRGWVTVA